MMYGHGKSDSSVVPTKPPNKATELAAEAVEGLLLGRPMPLSREEGRVMGSVPLVASESAPVVASESAVLEAIERYYASTPSVGGETALEMASRVLDEMPGVKESAVVGITSGAEERVHAVLVVEPGTDAEAVVRQANPRLQDHQRVRGVSVWPAGELPRTDGTRKLKRRAVRDWVLSGAAPLATESSNSLEGLIARYARGILDGDKEGRRELYRELGIPADPSVD